MRFTFLSLLLFLLLAPATAQQILTLATYQYDQNSRIENLTPLAEILQKRLKVTTQVKSYDSVSALIEGLRRKEVDVVLISTMGYLMYDAGQVGGYAPVVALQTAAVPHRDVYKSCLVSRKQVYDSTLEKLSDQAGQFTIAFVNPGSTSGNLIPRLALAGAGLSNAESQFKMVVYSKTHQGALEGVLNGKYDLAAFGSEELSTWQQNHPEGKEKLNLIWLSEEIPLGPVLVGNHLDNRLKNQIRQCLLTLHQQDKAALEAVKDGWTEAKRATAFHTVHRNNYYRFLKTQASDQVIVQLLNQFTR